MRAEKVLLIYRKLYEHYGPQYWWPAQTPFEVAVGAILTQSTSWLGAEKAIAVLKREKALTFSKMLGLTTRRLSVLIKPAGFSNVKALRLKNFLRYLQTEASGKMENLKKKDPQILRRGLLAVNGIGPETADSILLYALGKPFFVVDAYTKRIFSRHKMISSRLDYSSVQQFFTDRLPKSARLYNEFHALIVRCAKDHCRSARGFCEDCPLGLKGDS